MVPTLGAHVAIDVADLIRGRLLISAMSGAGKSWAIRRLLEQTYGLAQQIVIDPEGEFYTLRERFDYVLVGADGADCAADPRTARMLARRLLELGCSAIVDVYELAPDGRRAFVRQFLEALINAPKRLWHPALVVIDEAHAYAPEGGKAESAEAVKALMSRGRKRGFCGVLATQRLAKLAKDAVAEAHNVLIGRSVMDLDLKRGGNTLGISTAEAGLIRALEDGEFYALGPAFKASRNERGLVRVRVGPVTTTHPKAGGAQPPTPPAHDGIVAVLRELADLGAVQQAEENELQAARARIADLERQLAAGPTADVAAFEAAVRSAQEAQRSAVSLLRFNLGEQLRRAGQSANEAADWFSAAARGYSERIDGILRDLGEVLSGEADRAAAAQLPATASMPAPSAQAVKGAMMAERGTGEGSVADQRGREALAGPERRILDGMAQLEALGVPMPWKRAQVAFVSDYRPTGGSFRNALGRLHTEGLISYPGGGTLALEQPGRERALIPTRPPTREAFLARVAALLDGPERRVFAAIMERHPLPAKREEAAKAAGYSGATGGSFRNALGRLRTLSLVYYPDRDHVAASAIVDVAR